MLIVYAVLGILMASAWANLTVPAARVLAATCSFLFFLAFMLLLLGIGI